MSPIATAEKGVSLLETESGLQGFLNIPKCKNNKLESRDAQILVVSLWVLPPRSFPVPAFSASLIQGPVLLSLT